MKFNSVEEYNNEIFAVKNAIRTSTNIFFIKDQRKYLTKLLKEREKVKNICSSSASADINNNVDSSFKKILHSTNNH